jgi:catalase
VKISGADPDFHRRDLWEAIEAGAYPEYELGVQLFSEADAERFSFDVLDATKIVPEELVPVRRIGRLVLNRNPDNFFAETEQVAFCTAHVVPGIDFSNDPLLAGRIHSYVDTQISRLGGPNFHEIPVNAPVAQVHNNQRDGMHRQAIARGRVAYEPNSLGGGCPFQAGAGEGFMSFPEPVEEHKVRGKPEKFAEHYNQATLFWNSQTDTEKAHIVRAYRFELTKVQTVAVRARMLAGLRNVAEELAQAVADGLGMALPDPLPKALGRAPRPETKTSDALSLLARPGETSVKTRRIAILVADGIDAASVVALHERLAADGAVPRFVGVSLGQIEGAAGERIEIEISMEAGPAVLYDALVLPDGKDGVEALMQAGHAMEFLKDQYRHCKPILALGASSAMLEAAGTFATLPDGSPDPGVLQFKASDLDDAAEAFTAAIVRHRHWERETDPPAV